MRPLAFLLLWAASASADTSVPHPSAAPATLRPGSAFVDLHPPAGWVQCAGFQNTRGDDVNDHFADRCLHSTRLRLRVFGPDGELEEDVYVPVMRAWSAWPDHDYLAGDHRGGGAVIVRSTNWNVTDHLAFYTSQDGVDACGYRVAPGGLVFGTGWCDNLVIVAGSSDEGEYRVNNGGPALPGRRIALYR